MIGALVDTVLVTLVVLVWWPLLFGPAAGPTPPLGNDSAQTGAGASPSRTPTRTPPPKPGAATQPAARNPAPSASPASPSGTPATSGAPAVTSAPPTITGSP